MRLDAYLAQNYPEYSRATWQKYIEAGYVSMDGVKANKTTPVGPNHGISINIPRTTKEMLDLPIIYDDDNVVVIDKPVGVLAHSKGALNDEFTVADFIKLHAKKSDLPDNNRFGIVHRLDRATSGVMIGAKNADALKKLQKQFSERKVKKTYLALVQAPPKETAARIDLPIGRNPKHPSRFRVDPRGKNAITDYRIVKTFPDGKTLVELKPHTGRTHQLRVHLAHIGTPIIGDPIYGTGSDGRMMLHASELEITIPDGKRRIFKAETPAEFTEDK